MRNYKFWWYLAIIFTVVLFLKTMVFARETYIFSQPEGGYMITDLHSPATFVYTMPEGNYMITDFHHKDTFVNKIPGGYIYNNDRLQPHDPITDILNENERSPHNSSLGIYINGNDEESEVGLYYGSYQEEDDNDSRY